MVVIRALMPEKRRIVMDWMRTSQVAKTQQNGLMNRCNSAIGIIT